MLEFHMVLGEVLLETAAGLTRPELLTVIFMGKPGGARAIYIGGRKEWKAASSYG
jgi:hypothetical protein